MGEDDLKTGGCLCGATRYRLKSEPVNVFACHCHACQKRTGSAFGVSLFLREDDVEIEPNSLKTYEYQSDETGRWLRMEFCQHCGTNVTWRIEAAPGYRVIAGGTLDDSEKLDLNTHYWMSSSQKWVTVAADASCFMERG